MADVAALLSSVRAKLVGLAGCRDEPQAQFADIDQEHGRLAAAVSELEKSLQDRQGSPAVEVERGSRRLGDEIAGPAFGSGSFACRYHRRSLRGRSERRCWSPFPSRSVVQGRVTRQGVRHCPLAVPPRRRFRLGWSPIRPPTGPRCWMRWQPRRPVLVQRWSSGSCSPGQALHRAGPAESAVDTAITGLKKTGVLERRADGALVVAPAAEVPPPGGASADGS